MKILITEPHTDTSGTPEDSSMYQVHEENVQAKSKADFGGERPVAEGIGAEIMFGVRSYSDIHRYSQNTRRFEYMSSMRRETCKV